jgi:hypothetical protein
MLRSGASTLPARRLMTEVFSRSQGDEDSVGSAPMRTLACVILSGVLVMSCKSSPSTTVSFALDADLTTEATFYDFPYPSDLRVTASGAPDLRGWPVSPASALLQPLVAIAQDRIGFPTVPVAWFQFSAALPATDDANVIAADATSTLLLIDIDPNSTERGRLFPTIAHILAPDGYVPANLLAVAARPGIVLAPKRSYAFVVMRSFNDAAGHPLGVPAALAKLREGGTPSGSNGAQAAKVYAPLWPALTMAGIDPKSVAAATVFTTSDVTADLSALSDKVVGAYDVTIDGLAVDPEGGATHDRFCALRATVTMPEFQTGTPPYNTGGLFQIGSDGLPVKMRSEAVPLTITLPVGAMPATGYPLMMYFHGSGGDSREVVDEGPVTTPGGQPTAGEGPAYVMAPFGIAMAAAALPFSPERFAGAGEFGYLNFSNLASFRDNFRQGVLEQRLLIEALLKVQIPASVLGACAGPAAPTSGNFFFDPKNLVVEGWSMGGMYTNLVTSVEPQIRLAVPLGAGGYWSYFITTTTVIPNLQNALAGIFDIGETPKLLHPSLHLFETAVEASDPMVYMPRLSQNPLSGSPIRPIYEPVGQGDKFFPSVIYDAMALAYGHKEAGSVLWSTMQDALTLAQLDGTIPYSVHDDVKSLDGTAYTGMVVQYAGDGLADPHAIGFQLDSVKYQIGCFVSTFLSTGKAVVPAPAALGTPCPTQ